MPIVPCWVPRLVPRISSAHARFAPGSITFSAAIAVEGNAARRGGSAKADRPGIRLCIGIVHQSTVLGGLAPGEGLPNWENLAPQPRHTAEPIRPIHFFASGSFDAMTENCIAAGIVKA